MTNLKFIKASYSTVAWNAEFQCWREYCGLQKRYKIIWNIGSKIRLAVENDSWEFGEYKDTSSEEIVNLLPIDENWNWKQFLTAMYFFSGGADSKR